MCCRSVECHLMYRGDCVVFFDGITNTAYTVIEEKEIQMLICSFFSFLYERKKNERNRIFFTPKRLVIKFD